MWNRRCLQPPVECKIKVKLCNAEIDTLNDARQKLVESKFKIFDHVKLLTAEHYIIKRIIYKCINQMRRDKALASCRQVNSCLKRLGELKIESLRSNLQEYVAVDLSQIQPEEYLPSRQLLQYNLVRLMSAAALLTQTARYCSHTYLAVKQYLQLGNLVYHYLVFMAGSARVWYVCRSLRSHICSWYQALYPCLDIMAPAQVQWLPDTEHLPDNLSAWLVEQFGEEPVPEIPSEATDLEADLACQELDTEGHLDCMADLGVPVQRRESQANITDNVEDITSNKKKKKAKAVPVRDSIEIPKTTQKFQERRIKRSKKCMRSYLKSRDDLDEFVKNLNSGITTVGDENFVLSKLGRRKILTKIEKLQAGALGDGPGGSVDKVLLRRLCNCLGRMLVRYDKGIHKKAGEKEKQNRKAHDIVETSTTNGENSDTDHDLSNQSEDINIENSENSDDVREVSDTIKLVTKSKLTQMKKKEKKKTDAQINKNRKLVQKDKASCKAKTSVKHGKKKKKR